MKERILLMDTQPNGIQEENEIEIARNVKIPKKSLGLPIIALAINIILVTIVLLENVIAINNIMLLLALPLGLCGFIIGIVALSEGKKRIGIEGMIISIIAIIIPPLIVIFKVIIFMIGVETGMISFM